MVNGEECHDQQGLVRRQKRGNLGKNMKRQQYRDQLGFDWVVPKTKGAYPSFLRNDSKQAKQKDINFIVSETDIKNMKDMASLLTDHLMEAVEECYYNALHKGYFLEYDKVTLFKILDRSNKIHVSWMVIFPRQTRTRPRKSQT